MTRLRRVSAQAPGWTRRRCGRGFTYLDGDGHRLAKSDVERIKALAIPPAWTDVWICPHPRGHLQATGTDDAGRRQYLYHPAWREQRDDVKHERVRLIGARLPRVRARVCRQLATPTTDEPTVLAFAIRLIDLGCFRIGSEEYADANGSFGLTTLELRHVRLRDNTVTFRFDAKSGIEQEIALTDPAVLAMTRLLTRRRDPSARLLAWREGRVWTDISAADLNMHLQELVGIDATAKDLRTWHATVAVAEALAATTRASTAAKRRRQVRSALHGAADLLGNSVAVAEASYVDPRVIDLFEDGHTIGRLPRTLASPTTRQDRLDRQVSRFLKRHV